MTDQAAYFKLPAVNASSLKHMAVSPKHYAHALTHPKPDTPAMAKGRAIHCACLEPDEFPRRYWVWRGSRTTADWREFKATVPDGVEVLTGDEYDDVLATRDAVRSHPVAARYLRRGEAEKVLEWTDKETRLRCKARLDWVTPLGRSRYARVIVDLKTSRDISEHSFERTTHDLLYHVSAAHYVAGMEATSRARKPYRFVFVAVESSAPHDVRVGEISEDALYAGEQERRRLLELVASCTRSGKWPGRFPKETTFELPGWYYAQAEAIAEARL